MPFFKRTKILGTACELGLSLISLALSQCMSHLGLNTNIYLLYCKIIECVLNIQCHYNKINQSINQSAYNRRNYDGIKWKPGTVDIVINHWLNHLEHPDNVVTCSQTSCTCTGGSTTQS